MRNSCGRQNSRAPGQAREAGDAQAIAAVVGRAWQLKPDGVVWKGCTEATARAVSMRAVGG